MTITVYAHLAEEAKKRLDKVAKKAAKYGVPFSYTVGDEHPQTVAIYAYDYVDHTQYIADTFVVSAVDFEVNCDQLIKSSGWTVCAMIEHGDAGNIVTGFNNYPIPDAWYSCAPKCDHCHTNRARNVTFMVRNEFDGMLKQVGKACLKDYTGVSPSTALMFAEVAGMYEDDHSRDPEFFEGCRGIRMYSVKTILALAYMDIWKRGYRKSDGPHSTREAVEDGLKLDIPIPQEASDRADAIIEWSKARAEKWQSDREEISRLSKAAFDEYGIIDDEAHAEYLRRDREIARSWDAVGDLECNCFPLTKSGYAKVKHIGRLCYLPVAYDNYLKAKKRAEERDAANAASQYIGEIGERVTVKVQDADVLTSWETQYGTTYLNKIVDDAGNILIWRSSSTVTIKPGYTIRGTVKEHSEFKGTKQTVVTRCTVIEGR